MTLSKGKIHLAWAACLLAGTCLAADPPTAEMSAAESALAQVGQANAQGAAADALSEARGLYADAQAALVKKRYKDAKALAERSEAAAMLASARARLARAREQVDARAARNADLRRKLLLNSGG